jgi:4-hydroxybenzoate polyprenyltransferase/phosphoserine phosphatase
MENQSAAKVEKEEPSAPAAVVTPPALPIAAPSAAEPPLVVDLDGTLIHSDLLWESLMLTLGRAPWLALLVPFWLLAGRARLKDRLAQRAALDPSALPYAEEVVAWLRSERANGRRLVLATASDRRLAQRVADHLGLFDEVLASDGTQNLKGAEKARVLTARFGARGFDYVGDAPADRAVWTACRVPVVANPGSGLRQALLGEFPGALVKGARPAAGFKTVVRCLRCYQWSKNVLVFIPLFASHAWNEPAALVRSLVIFAGWCLVSSGVYVANDLMDLEADRRHARKRKRPFASGALPLTLGIALTPLLPVAGLVLAWWCSPLTALVLALYYLASTAYSLSLKEKPLVDVFILALLYTLRVIGGGVATDHRVSLWLLAFSSFLFLGLAFLKRCGELKAFNGPADDKLGRRGYKALDLPVLTSFGIGSAFLSSLVLTLYLQSEAAIKLYKVPMALYACVPLLLFWQCRLWLATGRGHMHDDPILYSAKDRVSWMVFILAALCVAVATRSPWAM